jgi:hypothetical protein
MRSIFKLTFLLAALLPSALRADVVSYRVVKQVGYRQTSNAQTTDPVTWVFAAQLVTDTDNEVQSASLSFNRPPPQSVPLTQQTPTAYGYNSSVFTTEADLDADYPTTTYTFTADLGGGPETGDVFLPDGLYSSDIPFFTGDTYDRLQSYDPSLAFDGTMNSFTLTPGTNVGATTVTVDEVGIGRRFTVFLDPSDTAFQIPASTLEPSKDYVINLFHGNAVNTDNAGFGGNALSSAGFTRVTGMTFSTVPAPGALLTALVGAVPGVALLLRRRRK